MIYNEQKTSQHLANACVTKKTQNSIRTQNQMSDPNPIFRCHMRKSCFHSGKLMRRNRKYRNTSSNGAFSIAMSIYQSVLVIFFFCTSHDVQRHFCERCAHGSWAKVITLLFISFFSSVGVNYSVNRKFLVSLDSGLTFFLVLLHFGMSTKR